jgi:tetratricopeptide (TPR) repeat protein
LAGTQQGDQKNQSYDKAAAAYKKSLELKPDDAGTYNQLGNLYGMEKKMPEAEEALTKAAQLDPSMAAKANFNIGAMLVNNGKAAEAAPYFKKAVEADPNYAEADYQLGSTLMMQGTVDPKTGQQTYPPDTAPALQKYLELQPNGPHAQEAQAMLQALGEKVQTNIHNPAATTPTRRRSK